MSFLSPYGRKYSSLSVIWAFICIFGTVHTFSVSHKRGYYYARNVHHLQDLTLRDLQAAKYLQSIRESIPVGSKLRTSVER